MQQNNFAPKPTLPPEANPRLTARQNDVGTEKKRLDIILGISEKIVSSLNLQEVLNQIMKLAVESFGGDSGSIMLLNEKTNRLHIKVAIGIKKEVIRTTSLKIGERIAGWVAKHNKPLLLLNGLEQYPEFAHFKNGHNIDSSVSIPLRDKRQLIGVLNINRLAGSGKLLFNQEDLDLVQMLANQAAIAINNARLHEQLKQQNFKLVHASRLKTELLSHITHELRTPLTAIKGHTSNILSGILGGLTAAQRERLEKIEKLSNKQAFMVNQLLEISQMASGKYKLKRELIALNQILDNVLDTIGPAAEEKKLTIENHFDSNLPQILGMPERLERVFLNLLSNAIKYTLEDGTIKITSLHKQDVLEITISDTGIGIPKTDLLKIFDEFYQVDNEINKKLPGTGLGLALVKHIIEAHKGKIWVKSTPGKGTTFTFTLPIDPRVAKRFSSLK